MRMAPVGALAIAPRRLLGALDLRAARHQLLAVVPRPAVELRVGELHVIRAHAMRHLEDFLDVIDVEAVQDHVEHHRILVLLDQRRDLRLQVERARRAQEIVHLARAVLEGELDVIESRLFQGADARLGEPDAGGDEVDVEPEPVGLGDDRLQIVARQRLSARQPELHGAERARLAQHPDPLLRIELGAAAREIRRVVAKGTVQRTSVSELEQEPQGRPRPGRPLGELRRPRPRPRHGSETQCFSCAMATNASTSSFNPLGRERLLEVRRDLVDGRGAVAALQDLAGARVQLDHALRIEEHVGILRGLPLQPESASDGGPRLRAQLAHNGTP